MFKKIWNKIKSWFTPKNEMDPHEEFYTVVPEPEIPVHKNHCDGHSRFIKSCPSCLGVVNG
tara:strand:+ start:340 stop:522 length:183 start_codon:yes stop_codon:yes gene_type:complete